jgi:hypothetical protein
MDKDGHSSEEEQNTNKPSYTYWKRDGDKSNESEFKPQKSETSTENNSSDNYGSVWNKAGTW